jgi:hypothetical protein
VTLWCRRAKNSGLKRNDENATREKGGERKTSKQKVKSEKRQETREGKKNSVVACINSFCPIAEKVKIEVKYADLLACALPLFLDVPKSQLGTVL